MKGNSLRIAVVTAYASEDWHSARILSAVAGVGEAVAVDPASLACVVEAGAESVLVGGAPSSEFDAFLLVRGLSPRGDADAQFAAYRALEEGGALVVNRLSALLDAQDKFRTSALLARAGVPTPRAALVQTEEAAAQVLRRFGEVVIKPLAGSLGEGVERVSAGPEGERHLAQRLSGEGALYVQQWVPNPGCDLRVFVVGGRASGAVERVAAPGDFRTNIARGAAARPVDLTAPIARIAERAGAALALDYSGVDIIETAEGPRVIEVNGNPAFDMIFEASGEDMAVDIARYVARQALERRPARGGDEAARGEAAPARALGEVGAL